MSDKANKPSVRFAGFADAWEQRTFSDLAETRRGLTYSPSDIRESGVRVLRSSNIAEDQFVHGEEDVFVLADAVNIPYAQEGDILITSANGSTRLVGKHTIIKGLPKQSAVPGGFMLLATAKHPEFVNALMSAPWYTKFISLYVAGGNGAIGNLNKNDLDEQIVLIPSEDEQIAIGKYFKGIDRLITLHQRKYDHFVNIKKSMLEKMFPKNGELVPKVRFAGFTGAWEQRKVSEIGSFSKGTGYSKSDIRDKGTPLILYGRLYTKYETVIRDVDTFTTPKDGSVYSRGGEVIIPASGETAEDISIASVVEKSGVILGGDLNIITPQSGIDSAFLALSISHGEAHRSLSKLAQGKSVVHIHNSDIQTVEVGIPEQAEQESISQFFEGVDRLITLHQRKLEKLKNIKNAFLEKMFI